MHTNTETLGDIIKYYREKSDYTVEELANRVGISERYLYRIENEGKKPSFDVLYSIIRFLYIPPDIIFYPELQKKNQSINSLFYMLIDCDEKTINTTKKIINIT